MLQRNRASTITAIFLTSLLLHPVTAFAQQDKQPTTGTEATPVPLFIDDAHDLRMEGQYEQAIKAYKELANDPVDGFEAKLGLARCRMDTGKYNEALSVLTQLGDQRSAKKHYLLAQVYNHLGEYSKVLKNTQQSIKIDKNHAAARRLRAQTLELTGKKNTAIEAYRWFDRQIVKRAELPRDPQWITETALGFLRYSVLTQTNVPDRTRHVLHEMLQMVYSRLDRGYWPARIAAADLLRERYNNDKEDGSVSDYLASLKINENLPQAYVGLGEVALNGWAFEEVEKQANLALQSNPNYAPAIHLLAKKLITERRYAQAIETCQRALKINPNDIVALSISAAAGSCMYDQSHVDRLMQRVQKINPHCAVFHQTMGNALSGIRQYAASETAFNNALEINPTNANAHTELGMMYMQWGDENKAQDALDSAWVLDPYNKRTKFTLELLDILQNFTRFETENFIVKYDESRDPGLGEYVASYLEEIYKEVTEDFNTPLHEKTIIEFFPTHRQFGVRITGKPWIHTVGASTGTVIAMDSPRAARAITGAYNIASVLKHEFTHTVTLAATQNRIPHWFTEGLAVYQEDGPRKYMWSEMLSQSLRRDELFTLESIDWGFMRPRKPNDRQLAYAQSEWMCEFIIDKFGYDKIHALITGYRNNQTQEQAIQKELGLKLEEFDRQFRVWAKTQVKRWGFDTTPAEDVNALRELVGVEPENPTLQGRLAKAEFDHENYELALTAARVALQLDENEPNGLDVMANILYTVVQETEDEEKRKRYDKEALPVLEKILTLDPQNSIAPKYAADIALHNQQWDRAVEMLKKLQQLSPADPTSWRGLAGIYLQQGNESLARPQLLELARIDDTDMEVAAKLGSMYKRRDRFSDAIFWFRRALSIDPLSVEIHQSLGDTYMQASDAKNALREYLMLTRIEPNKSEHFSSAARAAHKLGDRLKTRELAKKAVDLDPQTDVKSLLP